MKRSGLVLGLLCTFGSVVYAQEIPHLDFVRALRSQYGPNIADDYLKHLQQTAPNEITPRLSLEMAVIELELAEKAANAAERVRLTRQAEAELSKYKGPEATLIGVKILNLQARALTAKAHRDGGDSGKRGLSQAAAVYKQVENRLTESIRQLDLEIAKAGPKEKKALDEARLQAQFDLGVCLFDYAMAANPGSSPEILARRYGELEKARPEFDKVAKSTAGGSLPLQASAWLGRCNAEGGLPNDAKKVFDTVAKDRTSHGEAARRLVAYFRLLLELNQMESGRSETATRDARSLADHWLDEHRDQWKSPTAATVHYILGRAAMSDAAKPNLTGETRKKDYLKALEHFRKAEAIDNDFAGRARYYKLQCFTFVQGWNKNVGTDDKKLLDSALSVDLGKLATFDDLYDRAQLEMVRLREALAAAKGDSKVAEKLRRDQMSRVIEVLETAIKLGDQKDKKGPTEDAVNQARLLLTYAYMLRDDPSKADAQKTIATGMDLIEHKAAQAPDAAIYVLQGYALLFRDLKANKNEAELAQKRTEYFQFLDRIIQTWPDEQAADVALHQKAMALYDEKKLPEAIEVLGKVRPTYSSYLVARYQLAIMEMNGPDPKGKDRGIQILEQLPPLLPGADPSRVETYIRAKLLLAQPYQAAGKFQEMEATFPPLLEVVSQGLWTLPNEQVKKDLEANLTKVVLWTAYSKADRHIQDAIKKNPAAIPYPETRPFFDPVYLLFVKDGTLALMKADDKFRVGFMELILKAYLLDGKAPQAAELVRFQIKASPEKSDGGALDVVEPLVNQMVSHLAQLRAKAWLLERDGKSDLAAAKKAEADKLSAAFLAFLDETAKDPKVLNPEYHRLLGKGYLSVDRAVKASQQLKDGPTVPAKDAPPRTVQAYVEGRALYVRALREEKRLDDAENLVNELKQQDVVKNDPLFRVEEAQVLDERKKHREAMKKWVGIANELSPRIFRNQRDKELFYECYCHWVNSGYRIALTLDEPKKSKVIGFAAKQIADLEDRDSEFGGDVSKVRFLKLLDSEPALKQQYTALKPEKK